jgi:hypothetical protein
LTILEEGLISVPHRADSERDKGVLIDGTYQGERTMASFWSINWAGRAFFIARGSLPDGCIATVVYQEEDLK